MEAAISIVVFDPQGKSTGETYPPGSVWPENVEAPKTSASRKRNAARRSYRDCVVCGASFLAKREDAKFCSGKCRKRANRRNLPV